jgi:diphthamide biosynthesis enzyme Dph1/Dph2-like protein
MDLKEVKGSFRRVLIQIPDGLKPRFREILEEIKKRVKAEEYWIWFGSNFGACDLPNYLDVDAIIHIGHSELFYVLWKKKY